MSGSDLLYTDQDLDSKLDPLEVDELELEESYVGEKHAAMEEHLGKRGELPPDPGDRKLGD